MSTTNLKNKISKELNELDADQLQSAWLIVKALSGKKKANNHKSRRFTEESKKHYKT